MPNYIGQDFPNYQEQWPGPEAGLGMIPARKSQRTRLNLRAPLPLNNQLLPQQHLYFYRDDPSGAGPGGKAPQVHRPTPRFGVLSALSLLLSPRGSRLPVAPWAMINDSAIMEQRQATGQDVE